ISIGLPGHAGHARAVHRLQGGGLQRKRLYPPEKRLPRSPRRDGEARGLLRRPFRRRRKGGFGTVEKLNGTAIPRVPGAETGGKGKAEGRGGNGTADRSCSAG